MRCAWGSARGAMMASPALDGGRCSTRARCCSKSSCSILPAISMARLWTSPSSTGSGPSSSSTASRDSSAGWTRIRGSRAPCWRRRRGGSPGRGGVSVCLPIRIGLVVGLRTVASDPLPRQAGRKQPDRSKRNELAPADRLSDLVTHPQQLRIEQGRGAASGRKLETGALHIVATDHDAGHGRDRGNDREYGAEHQAGDHPVIEVRQPEEGGDQKKYKGYHRGDDRDDRPDHDLAIQAGADLCLQG